MKTEALNHEAQLKCRLNQVHGFPGVTPELRGKFDNRARIRDAQTEHDMLWIREPFLTGRGWPHPVTVVHGHTPEGPTALPHRIGVDSGVFASGRLTAVELSGNRLRFITARAED